jgi:phosphohistidine phosphatase
MAIYIVQHGKSLTKDIDPEKGLSEDGIAQVQRIAQVAKSYAIKVSKILHSGKKRALQTSEIFAQQLHPPQGVEAIGGIDPLDDVISYAKKIDLTGNQMLVGHLPFMSRLISYLVTGSVKIPVFKVQNGGIVCLDHDVDRDSIIIKWTLMPEIK